MQNYQNEIFIFYFFLCMFCLFFILKLLSNKAKQEINIISKNILECDEVIKLLELNSIQDFIIENSNICWQNNFKTRLLFDLINEKTKLNYNYNHLELNSDSILNKYYLLYVVIKKYYEDKNVEEDNNQYNSFKQKYLSEK